MTNRTRILSKRRLVVPAVAVLASTAASLSSAAINETHVYGVARLGGPGQCGSVDSSHPIHEDTAAEFASYFELLKLFGLWDEVRTRNNRGCRGSYWTDSTKAGSCGCAAADTRDKFGADDADVVFIHTHGGHTEGVRSGLRMGNDSFDCWVRTDDNMLFDADLDIAIIKSCQGGNYDVWAGGGYRQQFTRPVGSPLRMWNAFHGSSSCGSHVQAYVASYVWSSTYNGVGENWIDEAYDSDPGADDDDCPCSIAIGSNSSVRHTLFEYGGWRDRKSTGQKTGSTYFYISGCDPSSGLPLP